MVKKKNFLKKMWDFPFEFILLLPLLYGFVTTVTLLFPSFPSLFFGGVYSYFFHFITILALLVLLIKIFFKQKLWLRLLRIIVLISSIVWIVFVYLLIRNINIIG